jgi:UDP-N-acetylglucosamine/UDP-N-acetylgalactosamine diphosphorylase
MGQLVCQQDLRVVNTHPAVPTNDEHSLIRRRFSDANQGHVFDAWDTLSDD